MNFSTDKQTLDDLNLTGKHRPGSVYSLFDQVKTRGGERLLELYFRNPLTDPIAINQRTAIFRYLQEKDYDFPFDRQQSHLVEDYLGGPGTGNRLFTTAVILQKKWRFSLLKDEQYGLIFEGIRTTLFFLQTCQTFIRQFEEPNLHPDTQTTRTNAHPDAQASPLQNHIQTLKTILANPRLSNLHPTTSWQQIAEYHHLFRQVLQKDLDLLCNTLYELDLYIAVSKVAKEKDFSYALALPATTHTFRATNLRHPCLEKAVGNTLSLSGNSNILFLTGANMAGKSTFMKAFGISVYLAHMGFPVAAKDMVFSIKEGLSTSINVPDNLVMGYSHVYAEVQRVKHIADAVSEGKNMVVIFDELFKGTNVKDAYDATLAVTDAFSEYNNCFFIISTHITEVGESLREKRENIQFVYLPTLMEGSRPTYPYKLKEGISADRHGMMIIANEGILDIITRSS